MYEKTTSTLPIGREEILEARRVLAKYRQGKATLEGRLLENERWYRLRHWDSMRREGANQVEPVSAWLFNCIANKHADAMDNIPAPAILPRREADTTEAARLSAILPVILDQCDFEEVYHKVTYDKLKSGTGVYGVFWNKDQAGGGDVTIRRVDLLNLFWEPGVEDLQQSRNLFHVELFDPETLREYYPEIESAPTRENFLPAREEDPAAGEKAAVVDWYYKRRIGGRTVLHYAKFCGEALLFSTENDPEHYPNGLYAHGNYPFVFDPLFGMEASPCGFGYIDLGKSAQEYIDRGNKAVMENLLQNTRPRYFIRTDGAVNEAEFADMQKDFIHVEGSLGQDSVLPVMGKPLSDIYVTVLNQKVDELKETTGTRDISTGGTSSGVTAASAIAAMQEAGSKLSRDHNRGSYRAFRRVVLMVIELLREFYVTSRTFRVEDELGRRFVLYNNKQIAPKGGRPGPLFDLEVTARKQSAYSRLSQNELALQFYNAGFFNPAMAAQALLCLDMMDFDRKETVKGKIARQATLFRQAPVGGKKLQAISQAEPRNIREARTRVAEASAPR